ncbi:MAG: PEP-CTERM sorting domain-containing protein [Phycisphaerae bacterium]|nr:PEP-CTERM sorting domain-containing protein [Phycisphaerae bacterium]
MKNLSYSAATMLVIAGSAFAAKSTESSVLNATPGFTGSSGERTGFITPFDVTGIGSGDLPGAPINVVAFVNIGAGNAVNGMGWDVVLTAFGASWRSEIRVLVTDSTGLGGFNLAPGSANQTPGGPTAYSSNGQILKLANYAIPDVVALGDGLIRLEFFESYDDVAGAFDGVWNSGLLFLQTVREVPAPASVGLLGLAGVGLLGRKRR